VAISRWSGSSETLTSRVAQEQNLRSCHAREGTGSKQEDILSLWRFAAPDEAPKAGKTAPMVPREAWPGRRDDRS